MGDEGGRKRQGKRAEAGREKTERKGSEKAGEIVPQAYVSRRAYDVAGALAPLIRLYRVILLPVAWPTARLLDKVVGKETLGLFREDEVRELLKLHILDDSSEMSHVEGQGALNFFALDDRNVGEEAEPLHTDSILALPFVNGRTEFPVFEATLSDPFLHAVHRSRHKWVVITDDRDWPRTVLDADTFLRSVLMESGPIDPADFCHHPLIVTDPSTKLEVVLSGLGLSSRHVDGQPLHWTKGSSSPPWRLMFSRRTGGDSAG